MVCQKSAEGERCTAEEEEDGDVRALGTLVKDGLTFISRSQLSSLEIQFVEATLSTKNGAIAHL